MRQSFENVVHKDYDYLSGSIFIPLSMYIRSLYPTPAIELDAMMSEMYSSIHGNEELVCVTFLK